MTAETNQNIQSLNYENQTFEDIIENALCQDDLLSIIDMAKLLGFTESELETIPTFWEICSNENNWIYLSNELILGNLVNENGTHTIRNFYRNVLLENPYRENIDYKQVSEEHELIKSYYDKTNKRKPVNKKYYIITGSAYKQMLKSSKIKKGRVAHIKCSKVESLALCMKQYMTKYTERERDIQHCASIRRRLEMEERHERSDVIYIMSHEAFTSFYGCDYFKIGTATHHKCETKSSFIDRISSDKEAPTKYTVNFLLYVDDAELIRASVKKRFPVVSDWVKNVDIDTITDFIRDLLDLLTMEYDEVDVDEEESSEYEESEEEESCCSCESDCFCGCGEVEQKI
jgi:hypothetical protein